MRLPTFSLLLLSTAMAEGAVVDDGNSTIDLSKLLTKIDSKMMNTNTKEDFRASWSVPEVFGMFDNDDDGSISAAEFQSVVFTPEKIEDFVAWKIRKSMAQSVVDANNNGNITFSKLLSLMVKKMKNTNTVKVTASPGSYGWMDLDCNGFITAEEYLSNLVPIEGLVTQEDLEEIVDRVIKTFDMDGDGQLNYEEFDFHMW